MLLAKINSKNGFPVLVLPRGHRLKKLPDSFCNKNFRKMKICSWNTNESQARFPRTVELLGPVIEHGLQRLKPLDPQLKPFGAN